MSVGSTLLPAPAKESQAPSFDPHKGRWTARIASPFQSAPTEVEILLPSALSPGKRYPVLYILPVGRRNGEYGDGMAEAQKTGIADKLGVICVAPEFALVPWYGNHATDPAIRQEDYMVRTLVPFIDANFPTAAGPEGRWLLGFSKSGWGAVTLLFRHPEIFGYAAAWDAPFLLDASGDDWGPMGLEKIFGTREQMLKFLPTALTLQAGPHPETRPRLVAGPGKFWKAQGNGFGRHLRKHHIPHVFRADLLLPHRWDSGWFVPMAEELARIAREPVPEAPAVPGP